MENLDGTVITTSLPVIAADFHQEPLTLKLALTSYLLSLAIFIPISGWTADRFGARTVFQSAIAVFTFGSILCGMSNTLTEFVVARIIQGTGGAMMVPVGRLVLVRAVPREDLISAMAYLSIPALIGPIVGPPLGGLITTYFNWTWIFWLNVPVGIFGLILASLFIIDVREVNRRPLDLSGFVLSGFGLSLSTFGLTILGQGFVPLQVAVATTMAGLTFIGLYVRHARQTRYPLIDLRLLSIETFRASVVGGFMFRLGIGALPFLLPLLLQIGFGLTPFQSGCVILIRAVGVLLMKFIVKSIIRQFGFKSVLVVNAILNGLCVGLYGLFTPLTSWYIIALTLLLGGFFRSMTFAALNAFAFADVGPTETSQATSFTSVAQQLSLSLGVAIGAGAIQLSEWAHQDATLRTRDFGLAFLAVGALSATSTIIFAKLHPTAGHSLRPNPGTAIAKSQ